MDRGSIGTGARATAQVQPLPLRLGTTSCASGPAARSAAAGHLAAALQQIVPLAGVEPGSRVGLALGTHQVGEQVRTRRPTASCVGSKGS